MTRLSRAVAVLVLIGGSIVASGKLAGALNPATMPPGGVQHRIGLIVSDPPATATLASVQLEQDGQVHQMFYTAPYVPVAGDLVNVALVGSETQAGIILGGRAGQSGNLVANGNFQAAPILTLPVTASAPPYLWTHHHASGVLGIVAQYPFDMRLGLAVVCQTGVASADNSAVSAAIPVTPGETITWALNGRMVIGAASTVTSELRVAYFDKETAVYPFYVSETLIGTDTDTLDIEVFFSAAALVPAQVTHARAVVRMNVVGAGAFSGGTLLVGEVVAHRQ